MTGYFAGLRCHIPPNSNQRLAFRTLTDALKSIDELRQDNPRVTGFMLYRASLGAEGAELSPARWRSWQSVSPYALCAIVHSEDPLFFVHRGFWWAELRRQIRRARISHGPVRGVSTITQQLARNLFLRPERTLRRKSYEALIAAQLEHTLPKERILELYLNVVEWGAGTWGIESAARCYFQHSSEQLTPFEAVFLASLLPAPLKPFADANAVRALRAQRRLTSLLYGSGIISHTLERHTYAQIDKLEAVVHEGGDMARVLAEAAADSFHVGVDGDHPGNAAQVVSAQCGIAQRAHYEYFLREASSYVRGITTWPEWWVPPS